MAERVHAGCSAGSITSPTNSLSQTTMGMFFTTPAELSPAAKKSWKSFKILFVRSQQRSDSEIDYMRYGSSVAEYLYVMAAYHCAFRYCIPMDNRRPSLDLKHFNDICPDQNGRSFEMNFLELGLNLPTS